MYGEENIISVDHVDNAIINDFVPLTQQEAKRRR